MLYEGLYIGLAFLWSNLNFEVAELAKQHEEQQRLAAQQHEIDSHQINTVPEEDEPAPEPEPVDNGSTQGIADEGSSADM